MKVFIHNSDNTKFSNQPNIQIHVIFFTDIYDLQTRSNHLSDEKYWIFVIDDIEMRKYIQKEYTFSLIISKNNFRDLCHNYPNILNISNKEHPLRDTVIYFDGFDKIELDLLKVKAILLGSQVVDDLKQSVTHIVAFRMCGVHKTSFVQKFKNKVFIKFYIDYFWKKASKNFTEKDNHVLLNSLQAKLFMNCQIVFIGFPTQSCLKLMRIILNQGGSIIHEKNIEHATHVVCPKNFDFSENFKNVLLSSKRNLYKYVVNVDWVQDSLKHGYLMSLINYQAFIDPVFFNLDDAGVLDYREVINFEEKQLEKLKFGFDPIELSAKEKVDQEHKRLSAIKEMVKVIQDKVEMMNDFLVLKTNRIFVMEDFHQFFEVFECVKKFFVDLLEILKPLLEDSAVDSCYGLEIVQHFGLITEYYEKYIVKYSSMVEFIDKNRPKIQEVFVNLSDGNHSNNIDYYLSLPIKILLALGNIFNEIISHTSCHHPDLWSWNKISKLSNDMVKFLDKYEDNCVAHQKHEIVSKWFGNLIALTWTNQYLTSVDCMLIDGDEKKIPITMFIFDNSIMICKFTDPCVPIARYKKIKRHFSSEPKREQVADESKEISSRKLKMSKSIYRCSNVGENGRISKSSTLRLMLAKFHKIFTGLSHINLNDGDNSMYCAVTEYPIRDIVSISYETFTDKLFNKLSFTLDIQDRDMKLSQKLTFRLMPRIVKKLSDYKDIKLALPSDYEWSDYGEENVPWNQFVLEEKANFCLLFSRMINTPIKQRSPETRKLPASRLPKTESEENPIKINRSGFSFKKTPKKRIKFLSFIKVMRCDSIKRSFMSLKRSTLIEDLSSTFAGVKLSFSKT